MIALSIALAVVGLAAIWAARDVTLRLRRGSDAAEALRVAREAHEAVDAAIAALRAELVAGLDVVDRVRREHESVKASMAFGGRRAR